jgi:hypothetical protein
MLAGKEETAAIRPIQKWTDMTHLAWRRAGISSPRSGLQGPGNETWVRVAGFCIALVDAPETSIIESVHSGQVAIFENS